MAEYILKALPYYERHNGGEDVVALELTEDAKEEGREEVGEPQGFCVCMHSMEELFRGA